ncbi:MAG: response regulator [Deltaproteobacteria bacterium]|nr:response regulator [Deltaproteobacteria bacterium]
MANESSSRKVLLVDDDECIRALCEEALTIAGHQVSTAANGAEALDSLKEGYDLVVTDVNMPGLDGPALYRRALEQYPYLERRFVFMTGDDCNEVRAALNRADSIYLAKPFKIKELIDAVETAGAAGYEDFYARESRGKRSEQRFGLIGDCTVSSDTPGADIGAEILPAAIENVSRNGVMIRYAGEPLKKGDGLSISFGLERMGTVRRAKAVWSKRSGRKECIAGVRLVEPIPVYWILSALPQIDRAHNF